MLNKKTILLICVIIPISITCLIFSCRRPALSNRYNILLVTLDTTRADRIGCYGYTNAMTPNLDRMAQQGVLFEECRSVAPLTLPAHATLLTGLYTPEHGLRVNGRNRLAKNIPTLATVFSNAGYRTSAFIAAVVLSSTYGLTRGFDIYDDTIAVPKVRVDENSPGEPPPLEPPSRPANQIVDVALSWLEKNSATNFFCWVHLYDPHYPYDRHPDLPSLHRAEPYDEEIAFMDHHFGRLLRFLREKKLLENTVVIAIGDHGENLGEHGEFEHAMTLYEGVAKVPCIILAPGLKTPRRMKEMVSQIDVAPTILELSGLMQEEIYEPLLPGQGQSLLPLMEGKDFAPQVFYSETEQPHYEFGWAPQQGLVSENWKYIQSPRPELYNLAKDLRENENLYFSTPSRAESMKNQLIDLYRSMKKNTAASTVTLNTEEQRKLESLGYAGGRQKTVSSRLNDELLSTNTALRDVKEAIPLANKASYFRRQLIEGNFSDKILEGCRKLVESSPETVRFHDFLGYCLIRRHELKEAELVYRAILKDNPEDSNSMDTLASIMVTEKRYDEAIPLLRQSIQLAPESSRAWKSMGFICLQKGRNDEAVKHFKEALRIEPESHGAYKYMADALVNKGEITEAIKSYEESVRLNPGWTNAALPLVWILASWPDGAMRNPKRAMQVAWQLCEASENSTPEPLDALAAAYAAEGRYDKAKDYAGEAFGLAKEQTNSILSVAISQRITLYQAGKPYLLPGGNQPRLP